MNVPGCFWLTGINTGSSTFSRVVNGSYRGFSYTVTWYAVAGYTGSNWNYGDGGSFYGNAGTPWQAGGTCSNQHTYGPSEVGGHYSVGETSYYGAKLYARVDTSWGYHDRAPGQLIQNATISKTAPSISVVVFQGEGVPVS